MLTKLSERVEAPIQVFRDLKGAWRVSLRSDEKRRGQQEREEPKAPQAPAHARERGGATHAKEEEKEERKEKNFEIGQAMLVEQEDLWVIDKPSGAPTCFSSC